MGEKIRFSTRYLGVQLFTLFINPTGWDSIGFSFPFWVAYIFIREIEKKSSGRFCKVKRKTAKETIFLISWLMLDIIFAFVYYKESGAAKLAFYYLVGGVFLISIIDAEISKEEILWILDMYVKLAIMASVLLFIQRVPVRNYTNRWTISILGSTKDPNYFSAYLMFPFLLCFYRYLKGRRKALLYSLLIFGAILLTGSRSSFLALALGSMVIVFGNLNYVDSFKKIILVAIVATITLFVVLPDDLIIRLTNISSYNDGSNQLRYNIWTAALEIWKRHFVFGAGQNVVSNYGTDYGAYRHMMTHNTYLDMLAEFGLVGFLLFISMPIRILVFSFKQKNILVMAGVVTTLATSMIISAQYSQYYWFNLALFYTLIKRQYVLPYIDNGAYGVMRS